MTVFLISCGSFEISKEVCVCVCCMIVHIYILVNLFRLQHIASLLNAIIEDLVNSCIDSSINIWRNMNISGNTYKHGA